MTGETRPTATLEDRLDRHWVRYALLACGVLAAWFVWQRWGAIQWLALGDTDDNLRLAQVRAWLGGQGWYDLRQYRLGPPQGFNIHWSRIPDLPIAGLILLTEPFVGRAMAERIAVAGAPLVPLVVALMALAFTVRKLVAGAAWPIAFIFFTGCTATLLMFMPLRIDHHNWQLACLSLTLAGLADPRKARGGAIIGLSSAFSLSIGLEMLPYCVMAGAITGLRWVIDRDESRRLQVYALSLVGGCTLGFAMFASNDNWAMRCDALTPIWLAAMVAAGGALFVAARIDPASRWVRLGLLGLAGGVIGGGFALLFPHCLSRPEGVSDELMASWLNNVREAKPIYEHPWRAIVPLAVIPVIGMIGAALALWRAKTHDRIVGWIAVALFGAFAFLMLFWQVRAGPAAQLLALPGATALAWMALALVFDHPKRWVRVGAGAAILLTVAGLFVSYIIRQLNVDPPSKTMQMVSRANRQCAMLSSMRQLDRALPPTTLFTHVDLGPRLIATTHHSAIAGPYHRNGDSILAVHNAFKGSPQTFLANARQYGATHLLTCPMMAETTVYRARAPGGFYDRMAKGETFPFLVPVQLPRRSPYRLWRIDYDAAPKLPASPSTTN